MNKYIIVLVSLMILGITSCSNDSNETPYKEVIVKKEEPVDEKEKEPIDDTKEKTLASKFLGTYECTTTKVERDGVIKGKNLKLYCFITPSEKNEKDKVTIEVRNWSGNFMPHLLSFRAEVKLIEAKGGKFIMEFPENSVIPYEVQGIEGNDKKGNVTGKFVLNEKEIPSFESVFFVFSYTMVIKSTRFKTKTVLPNANSSLL